MQMAKQLILTLIIVLFGVIGFTVTAAGSVSAEEILQFDGIVQVNPDGTIQVTETIVYNFGPEERHGIFRTIPFIKKNQEGKQFQMSLDVLSVTNEQGTAYQFAESEEDKRVQIKIGDPDSVITGIHTYKITYIVRGALTYFSEHDELYWNATGNEWQIPIRSSTYVINLPKDTPMDEVAGICYTGVEGSTDQNCTVEKTSHGVVFQTAGELGSGEGLTVAARFPKGLVAVLEPEEYKEFFETFVGMVVMAGIILAAVFWYLLYPLWLPVKWWLYGRDPDVGKAPRAWYDPPETSSGRVFSPAETGTMIDEKVDNREIVAMMVDLARRGYLKFIEKGKNHFLLKKVKEPTDLDEIEKDFIDGIFNTSDEVDLKKKKMHTHVEHIKTQIYDRLTNEGFFPENPKTIRLFYGGMIGAAAATFNILLLISASLFGLNIVRKTKDGARAANKARAMKSFLTSQERQLQFQAEKQLFFEKLLPFAIAFGVEKKWADRFKDMDMTPPDWYEGDFTNGYNTGYLVHNLSSASNQVNQASAAPVSSSGHSSGFSGGSSGGGGGGGGGGSW
jgi:uncharacterized membrane protein YgcG